MPANPIYKIVETPIGKIKPNPSNPRIISEEKFQRLVESIQKAPWMLKLRPIVVNADGVILGGNQRFKACKKAGMSHVWVIWADEITDEQQRKFILRDNVDFGKWDQEILLEQYSKQELLDYGVPVNILDNTAPVAANVGFNPVMGDDALEPVIPDDEVESARKNFNDNTIKQIVFQLPTELYEQALKDLDAISRELDCDDNSEVFLRLLNFYEISNGLSNPDNDTEQEQSWED